MADFTRNLLVTIATAAVAVTPLAAHAQPWRGDNDRGRGGERVAVDQCTRAATDAALQRGGRHADARVTDINSVKLTRDGYRVAGKLAAYQRGWNGASYQRGRFTCRVDHGRVVDLDIRGLGDQFRRL